jgi:SAM-dependent methyltransferase
MWQVAFETSRMQPKETNMDATVSTHDEPTTPWNGASGHAWVEAQELLDRVLQPIEDRLLEAVPPDARGPVLDVGCGTGSTTLAVARLLGPTAETVGIDISEPMLVAARARAERNGTPTQFIHADAATYAFEPASIALFLSRFGVMFFDDPVRAFANLRRAARDAAELRFIAWRSAADNPFMTTAEHAAAPFLPNLPARRPDKPGQFSFGDERLVSRVLEESGWGDIAVRPLDATCALPEDQLVPYVTKLGPVGLLLRQADEQTRAQVIEHVRPAFAPFVHGDEVRFTAACWVISARATGGRHE